MSEKLETYVINERFMTRAYKSQRVVEIAESFGLGLDDKEFVVFDEYPLEVAPGDIIYITGQSGGGKSLLLRNLARQMQDRGNSVIHLDQIEFESDKPIIDQIGTSLKDALRLMSIAGLNDAFQWLRAPHELSDGQRYRFRIAKAIETGAQVWCCDEFLAILDRTSAKFIAYSIQKAARKVGATLIVATTHTDLCEDLAPNLLVNKRFREKVLVERLEQIQQKIEECAVTREQLQQLIAEVKPW